MKQQATYEIGDNDFIKVGYRAEVFCKTHPRQELVNRPVHTSCVTYHDHRSGVFETLNTVYTPS